MTIKASDSLSFVWALQCRMYAWQIKALKPLLGPLKLKIDIGFEIDNIWFESNDVQSWYPIPGYDLRAPVVWYVLPSL